VTPTIIALREKFEAIRNRELGKILSLYPTLTEKEKQSLEAMTSAIINKILHDPLTLLKQTDEEAMSDLYLDVLRTLFQVSEKTLGESDTEKEKED
jgi:glutamyl-tRNA reductase